MIFLYTKLCTIIALLAFISISNGQLYGNDACPTGSAYPGAYCGYGQGLGCTAAANAAALATFYQYFGMFDIIRLLLYAIVVYDHI